MFRKLLYFFLFLVTLLIVAGVIAGNSIAESIKSLTRPTEVISNVVNSVKEIKHTDGKTNFLVLGVDKRSDPNSSVNTLLTDVIIVISIDKRNGDVLMTSIPRDLWIDEGKYKTKINSIYAMYLLEARGQESEDPNKDAVEALKRTVQSVTGLPIHYYAIVDFNIFIESIDAMGGVEINVQNAFVDHRFPIEGRENHPDESKRYESISFKKGLQTMSGETALKFARSRHSLNPLESGDFARSRRQQQVISAIKNKALSTGTLSNPKKILELYTAYSDNVESDFAIADLSVFIKSIDDLKNGDVKRIVLSSEPKDESMPGSGTLRVNNAEERETLYYGQFALIPIDKSFNEIHALIRSFLFENDSSQE